MDDSVTRDAKRLLLRYGAPISVVEQLSDDDRVTYARSMLRSSLSNRQARLRELLAEGGWIDSD